MNVRELVKMALVDRGFDGLYNDQIDCACQVGDISPGDCINKDCHAGYEHVHSVTGDFVISSSFTKLSNDEIQEILDRAG